MTEVEAVAYVTLYAQTEAFPALDTATVEAIVRRNKRASVWVPETDYNVGDRVQPATRNGRFYECVQAGASDEVEPTWSLAYNARIQEFGSDLVWQECAIDIDGNLYNLRNAVHEAWMLKAAASAKEFDVSVDQQSWKRSQVHAQCLEMAAKWTPYD